MDDSTRQRRHIKSAHAPSHTQFVELSENFAHPLLLTGVADQWPARKRWDLAHLRATLADTPVRVSYSPEGYFSGDPHTGFLGKFRYMPFQRFCMALDSANPRQYYLSQQSLDAGAFLELKKDLGPLPYFDNAKYILSNVWIGGAGVVSPLHHDSMHNIFMQIRGRKRFVLYSPADSQYLYPYPADSKVPHMSQLNIDHVDHHRFPLFRQAEAIEVVVEPGSSLYLPRGWWHQVYSLTTAISLNFWSNTFAVVT
jgi:Cupin-like domain